MRLLFVTYCFGSHAGQALIGVYKRGLRLAMAMHERGHSVVFYCTGRDAYHDELTATAQRAFRFVDIPLVVSSHEGAQRSREVFARAINEIDPDLLVIGEAPLSGAMLEATLTGVELGRPVVVLDNAYNSLFVNEFVRVMGSMLDGIVLAGPSSHHAPASPPYVAQVAPFIECSVEAALELVPDLSDKPVVTILAYDAKVEQLGISLIEKLPAEINTVFCSSNPERCRRRLQRLDPARRDKAMVIAPPAEPLLMGLLRLSRLAVVKYGFMQVSECLALGTPLVAVYHEGPNWMDFLPPLSRRAVHVTDNLICDSSTVRAAQRLLETDPALLHDIHAGPIGGIAAAAEFIELLPGTPRSDTTAECEALGFTRRRLLLSLQQLYRDSQFELCWVRAMRVRERKEFDIYSLVCQVKRDGNITYARLWGRRYASMRAASAGGKELVRAADGRELLYLDKREPLLIEKDIGEARLPAVNLCDE